MTGQQTRSSYGEAAAQISRELVTLHKQFYGKGPVKAKTYLVNDTVLCTLEGGFTIVERTLIDSGREQTVHDIRSSFQAAMEEAFVGVIERALSRTVRAYMSQVHTNPDVAVELFMLEPGDEHLTVEHEERLEEEEEEEEEDWLDKVRLTRRGEAKGGHDSHDS